MSSGTAGKLYSTQLLSLATQLGNFPLDETFSIRAQARSRTCGSTIDIGLALRPAGQVERIGLMVSACAIGQASAAVLAQSAHGKPASKLIAMEADVRRWLEGTGTFPMWPGFEALAPALPHKGRHGALLLPWKGAYDALSKEQNAR